MAGVDWRLCIKNLCVNFDRNGALSKSYIVIIVKIKIVTVTKQLRLVNHTKPLVW
jgi:hypothetical protein